MESVKLVIYTAFLVIQYFPVWRETTCGRSRGTDRRLVRESMVQSEGNNSPRLAAGVILREP